MLLSCKSASIAVNNEQEDPEQDSRINNEACTSLTVWTKSLVFSCQGFTVIGSDGSLVYRVDNYSGRPGQVILMDGTGNPILSMLRRKKLGLVDRWLVFEGEVDEYNSKAQKAKKPIFMVRKSMNILQAHYLNVLAYVYDGGINGMDEKRHTYVIEGSYAHRSCRVLDHRRHHESKRQRVVAEIKKKEATRGGISFGVEVFVLMVRPGFDSGFAMAFILLLDQMFS